MTSVYTRAENKDVSRAVVEELIRSLDARTLAERSHAERQMLELGPEVLRFLPATELIESLSAREAVRRIRPQLERRAARESSAAALVTLQGERTLHEILDELIRQSRNQLVLTESGAEVRAMRWTVTWSASPFWDCLDDLCLRAGLEWCLAKGDAAICISKRVDDHPQALVVQRTGPFRLSIESVETRFVVGGEQQQILRIVGRITVEPRLRPLFLSMAARELKAKTNDEKLLPAWNPEAKYEFPVGDGGREVSVQWDFRLPADVTAKSVSVRGQLHCQIAAATERISFDHKSLVRGTIRRRGGVSVRLRHVAFDAVDGDKLNGDIGIAVSYDDGGPAFESHRSWIFHNAVYFESKATGRINFTDFDTTQQSDGAVAVDYRWKKIDGPANQYSFVYEAPTLILDVPVNVELLEIPVAQ